MRSSAGLSGATRRATLTHGIELMRFSNLWTLSSSVAKAKTQATQKSFCPTSRARKLGIRCEQQKRALLLFTLIRKFEHTFKSTDSIREAGCSDTEIFRRDEELRVTFFLITSDMNTREPRHSKVSLAPSEELSRLLSIAVAFSEQSGSELRSDHVLNAIYTVPNQARDVLRECGLHAALSESLSQNAFKEPKPSMRYTLKKAQDCARESKHGEVHTTHFLLALIRNKRSIVAQMMRESGASIDGLEQSLWREILRSLPVHNNVHHQHRSKMWASRTPKASEHEELTSSAKKKSAGGAKGSNLSYRPYRSILSQCESDNIVVPTRAPKKVQPDDELQSKNVTYAPTGTTSTFDAPMESLRPESCSDENEALNPFSVSALEYPWIGQIGRNLCELAFQGGLDEVHGRENEITRVVDILGKRRVNNPCLVGEAGVGKSAIAEGLAVKIASGDPGVKPLHGRIIIELSTSALTAGTALRGSFSERLQGIIADIDRSGGRFIVFLDEIHTLMGAGGGPDGAQDAANALKTVLARGHFPCIGSTTTDEYERYIENDGAMARRFVKVQVREPSREECESMLVQSIERYESHHGVQVSKAIIRKAVAFSQRFIFDRKLPGKAVDFLDLAMSRCQRLGLTTLRDEQLAWTCHELTGTPFERVKSSQADHIVNLSSDLGKLVFGHDHALEKIESVVMRHFAGFQQSRPMGAFFLIGSQGIGKSHIAQTLAKHMFGRDDACLRLDMGMYSNQQDLQKLIGAPPGYLGYQDSNALGSALRSRPHQLVHFKNIHHAAPSVQRLIATLIGEGQCLDGRGRVIDARNAMFILSADHTHSTASGRLGFMRRDDIENPDDGNNLARELLENELAGSLDETLLLSDLSEDSALKLVATHIARELDWIERERGIDISIDNQTIGELLRLTRELAKGEDRSHAERASKASMLLGNVVARALLRDEIRRSDRIRVEVHENLLTLIDDSSFSRPGLL